MKKYFSFKINDMVHYNFSKCLTEHLGVVNYVCWTVFKNISLILNTDLSHLSLSEDEKKMFTVWSLFPTASWGCVFYLTRFPHFFDMLIFSAPIEQLVSFPCFLFRATS